MLFIIRKHFLTLVFVHVAMSSSVRLSLLDGGRISWQTFIWVHCLSSAIVSWWFCHGAWPIINVRQDFFNGHGRSTTSLLYYLSYLFVWYLIVMRLNVMPLAKIVELDSCFSSSINRRKGFRLNVLNLNDRRFSFFFNMDRLRLFNDDRWRFLYG